MACEVTYLFVMLLSLLLVNVTFQACNPPCLYFSAGRVIKSIELSSNIITSNVTKPEAHGPRFLAVAGDVEEKTLYISDQVTRTIKRIDLKSSKIEDVASEVGHCEDMAIDWVNKYIYWTDNKNGRIEMSRVDGSDRKLLFDRDVQYPRGIAVDPVHGYLFWTDYGDNPKIERATLAGQERTVIIANTPITRLKYPNDVIVDYASNRIYWVDGGLNVIGTADLKGRNIMISEPIKTAKLFALALNNNTLYITETNAKSIIAVDKESLREMDRFTQTIIGSRDLLGLTMLHESRQPPVISPCSHENGGCSHLCFIVPDGYRCGCPNGTALREDGYSCQEANFTNCRNQPCQNGGTCYFNFQRFADDCTCSKYYVEKDCGLYLGAGAVGITLEMNVEKWENEKFKQAIMRGLDDYCKRDNCGLRNESISKQLCSCFLNTSACLNATQVTVIGQPEASPQNHTKVDFAVILRPVSSLKPQVVVNATLEHIIWNRANFISKHLNKIVLVNNLHPSLDTGCNDVKPTTKEEEPMQEIADKGEDKTKTIAMATGIPFGVVILFVLAVILYRLRFNNEADQTQNQPRDNNEVGNDHGLAIDNRGGVNLNIADNRKGDYLGGQQSAAGNKEMSFPQGRPMPQETSTGAMENLNTPGNQHRDNYNEGNCDVTCEDEVAHESDYQQLEKACEDRNTYQALVTSQESFAGSATARHPTENDDDVSGTYTNPVQCTDDVK